MQSVKEHVLNIINSLLENVSIDTIMEEIYFKIVVDKGLYELDFGQGVPHSEVTEKFKKIMNE